MATKRDPWQPIGTLVYHFVQLVGKTTGFTPLSEGAPMSTEYAEDPEPRWFYCLPCGGSTMHEAYAWVMDGDTDYECVACGAVTYG